MNAFTYCATLSNIFQNLYDSGFCRDHTGSKYGVGEIFYRQNFAASGGAETSAADVVLVVDESGSIDMKVLWIREVWLPFMLFPHRALIKWAVYYHCLLVSSFVL